MTMTAMKREIDEIPAVTARLLESERGALAEAAKTLQRANPGFVATIARGSSDHAATFLKYACETNLGIPVASLGPSIASVYGTKLKLESAAAIGISQSGASPDIVAMLASAARAGATTLAITNAPASPLAKAADSVIDIHAGAELSVAATKTFVTSLVAALALIGHWGSDSALLAALETLPAALERALECDWSALVDALGAVHSLYVLGRGPGMAIAAEAALKFKETSGLHAESYSTAEVLHGPSAIARDGFPVLVFGATDASGPAVRETAARLADQGARIFMADADGGIGTPLSTVRTAHPLTDPITQIVAFYGFAEVLARARGRDPDHPPHLNKVTATR